MITFYWAPRSSATRIYWAFEELGIPHEKVKLDIHAGDTTKAEFLALNPNGKVPLIVDGGVSIFESTAILAHLGISYGQDKGVWPSAGAKLHGQALSWLAWSAATMSPIMFRARDASRLEETRPEIEKLFAIVEDKVSRTPYFLGDSFTFVDLAVTASMNAWQMAKQPFPPAIQRWRDACQARPAFKTTMAAQT